VVSNFAVLRKFIINYKAAYTGLPRSAWLLSLVVLINRSGSMVLFFLVLYLTTELDFSISKAGQMVSVYGFGSIFGAYLGGWISDRIGTLKVMTFSLVVGGLGFVLLSFLTNPLPIGIALFFLAVIAESLRPANSTALAMVSPPESRPRAFALNRMAVNLGVTIGPALGGFLALYNYHLLFWIDGLTCIIAACLLWILFHKSEINRVVEVTNNLVASIKPWKDSIFLMILFLIFLLGNIFIQVFNTWPLYLRQFYNLTEDQIGLLLALNGIIIVIVELPLIYRLEGKRHLNIMALGSFFLASGFGILPFGDTFIFAVVTVIIFTIGEMLVFPLVAGFIANRATDENRGKYMGMFGFTFSLSFVVGPLLGSWIYDHISPDMLWFAIIGTGLITLPGFLFVETILAKSNLPHK